MPEYLRRYVPGGQYFFTLITERRQPILADKLARDCLRNAIKEVQIKRPFKIEAVHCFPTIFIPYGVYLKGIRIIPIE